MESDTMFNFLTIANLAPSKGILILLDACARLTKSGADYHLHVVGAATAEISAERFSQEIAQRNLQEFVTYHGRQYGKDKEARFAEAKAFVYPTLDDCFPLVILEAMQHSLPVITTPVGAIPDIVNGRENGILIPENDAAALTSAMLTLITTPQLIYDVGVCGNACFARKYTLRAFEHNLLEILKEV